MRRSACQDAERALGLAGPPSPLPLLCHPHPSAPCPDRPLHYLPTNTLPPGPRSVIQPSPTASSGTRRGQKTPKLTALDMEPWSCDFETVHPQPQPEVTLCETFPFMTNVDTISTSWNVEEYESSMKTRGLVRGVKWISGGGGARWQPYII